jgi:hypothetical protein
MIPKLFGYLLLAVGGGGALLLGMLAMHFKERAGLGLLCLLGALACGGGAIAYLSIGTPVYVVKAGPVVEEKVLLFETEARVPSGKARTLDHDPSAWVVNETDKELQLRVVYYGMALGNGGTTIPPNHISRIDSRVDHFGPSDPPPDTITSNTSIDSRTWLTW